MFETRLTTYSPTNRLLGIEADEKTGRVIRGYAAVFYDARNPAGTQFELWPGMMERIGRNAFDVTLKSGFNFRALYNHDSSFLLATSGSKTLRLSVDNVGLRYEIEVPDTPTGHEISELCRKGILCGSSFMFSPVKVSYLRGGNGEPDTRILEAVNLYETGPVVWPAYEATTAGLRVDASAPSRIETAPAEPEYIDYEKLCYEASAADRLRRRRKVKIFATLARRN